MNPMGLGPGTVLLLVAWGLCPHSLAGQGTFPHSPVQLLEEHRLPPSGTLESLRGTWEYCWVPPLVPPLCPQTEADAAPRLVWAVG